MIMKLNKELLNEKNILMFRIITCIICWIAILFMIIPSISNAILSANMEGIGFMFSTYTFQSNLWVVSWITIALLYTKKEEKPFILGPIVRGAVTLYITVTLIIFAVLLQIFYFPTDPREIIINILAHYLVPILFIIDWYLTQQDEHYEKKYALYWLIYPFCYLGYSVIVELTTGVNIYYFISIGRYGPLMIVFVVLLTVFFYGLGRLFIFVNQRRRD